MFSLRDMVSARDEQRDEIIISGNQFVQFGSLSRFVCLICLFDSFVKSDGLLRHLAGNRKSWNKC